MSSIIEKKELIEVKKQQIALLKAEIATLVGELKSDGYGLLDDFRVTCIKLENLDILGE
jgi:hypothetical protein